jgi:predicted alpha-1,2-mannosidase
MGVSFVSCENAWENLDAEQAKLEPGVSNFETVRAEALAAWESDLSRIKVSGGTERDLEVFYSALYHTLIHPSILNDVNGEYPLMENDGVGRVPAGQNRYSVFSLWDTYRNVHQLMTLVYPERQMDMVRSMISMYKEWGWMPKWELFGRETFTMEGDPSIPVITDTWLKGLRDFDIETAYEAFVKSATTPGEQNLMRPDIDPYLAVGYVPLGFYSADASGDNSVSHALEYYIADYALSLLAADLGHTEDAEKFRAQSLQYKHYYCPEFGTLRPLQKDGTFLAPFNPRQGENFEPVPGFHEGSAWNYTFYVPHDVLGLAKVMGGRKAFVNKLQKVFDEGLYDPANEPDIAYPYLFSYFKGEEWRTAKIVSDLLDKHYTTRPDGIPGNDDTGTMSAWAVFSMMGFYPDCPGNPSYTLTMPRFDRVEITLDPRFCDGRDRLVITKGRHMKGRVSHNDLIHSNL